MTFQSFRIIVSYINVVYVLAMAVNVVVLLWHVSAITSKSVGIRMLESATDSLDPPGQSSHGEATLIKHVWRARLRRTWTDCKNSVKTALCDHSY